jgi:tRNA(fMet)-specific endonuclease VapC
MNGSCLLDTSIVIGLLGNDASIVRKIKSFKRSIYIPSIVLGELFYGVERSTKKEENRERVESLAETSKILDCDLATARTYGMIKSALKLRGTPIPENDIWISALAVQYNLVLITRDKHFDNVEMLTVDKW